jgi:hypothetical protein
LRLSPRLRTGPSWEALAGHTTVLGLFPSSCYGVVPKMTTQRNKNHNRQNQFEIVLEDSHSQMSGWTFCLSLSFCPLFHSRLIKTESSEFTIGSKFKQSSFLSNQRLFLYLTSAIISYFYEKFVYVLANPHIISTELYARRQFDTQHTSNSH